jgi:LmbE family N-acetylglucosaminyl deacetylase
MTVSISTRLPFVSRRPGRERVHVQVVVAHPDDETFGCGSLLLCAAEAGMVTSVCCATRGDAGEWPAGMVLPAGGIAEQRENELRDAAAALGVSRVDVLDFADSGMSGEPSSGSLAGADEQAVADGVRRAVLAVDPDVLVTLDGSDGHRDHARVRDTTVAVGQELGIPVYLACLSRRLMGEWAAHMSAHDPGSSYLALGELGTPDEDIDLVVDTSAQLERREAAIRLHRSQVSPFEGLPADLRRAFLTREHLVGPVPATFH